MAVTTGARGWFPGVTACCAGRRRCPKLDEDPTSMTVRIRLARGGTKKRPFYRIVAISSRSRRDGGFLEKLGTYNPILPSENPERVVLREERIRYWLGVGAQPSDRVARFLDNAGITKSAARWRGTGKKAEEIAAKKAEAAAEAAAAAPVQTEPAKGELVEVAAAAPAAAEAALEGSGATETASAPEAETEAAGEAPPAEAEPAAEPEAATEPEAGAEPQAAAEAQAATESEVASAEAEPGTGPEAAPDKPEAAPEEPEADKPAKPTGDAS
jgi:small subunit ribosomal protein S16